jgi:hypothetical protein
MSGSAAVAAHAHAARRSSFRAARARLHQPWLHHPCWLHQPPVMKCHPWLHQYCLHPPLRPWHAPAAGHGYARRIARKRRGRPRHFEQRRSLHDRDPRRAERAPHAAASRCKCALRPRARNRTRAPVSHCRAPCARCIAFASVRDRLFPADVWPKAMRAARPPARTRSTSGATAPANTAASSCASPKHSSAGTRCETSFPVGLPMWRSSLRTTTSLAAWSTKHDGYSICAKDAAPMPGMGRPTLSVSCADAGRTRTQARTPCFCVATGTGAGASSAECEESVAHNASDCETNEAPI